MGLVSRIGLDPEVAIVSRKTGKGRSAHNLNEGKAPSTSFIVTTIRDPPYH